MKKDYKNWHVKKEQINALEQRPFFHEREIWFCYVGANVGFEQDGRGDDFQRPVVVLKKFNNQICWVVCLSRTNRRGKYYYAFPFDENTVSVAILSQIKLIDVERLSRKIGEMSKENFCSLTEKLKALFP